MRLTYALRALDGAAWALVALLAASYASGFGSAGDLRALPCVSLFVAAMVVLWRGR